MSNPENKLSKFNSYSAHHTLMMCDGMKTADLLYGNKQVFTKTGDDPEKLLDVQTIQSDDDTDTGRYIVLFDGRTTTDYFIKSVSWETILAPKGAQGESKFEQIETEGEMIIEEPYGIEFLEVLVKGTRELEVDPSAVVFMLKTYFVGYGPDGEQDIVDDILPFTFVIIDLQAEMKAKGSLYKITLFGTANGVSHLPQISSLAGGLVIPLKEKDTLQSAITSLENMLKDKYEKQKAEIRKTLEADLPFIDNAAEASSLLSDRYTDVKYKINLGEDYSSSEYVIGTDESHDIFNDGGEYNMKFSERSSVESCIRDLMKTCKKVNEEATENPDTNISYSPKIVSALTSPEESGTYEVTYTVHRYETKHQKKGVPFEPGDGEFIEFDYIYTGNNIDILDFDIKMEMGLAFFQTELGPVSSPSTQEANVNESNTKNAVTSAKGNGNNMDESIGTAKLPAKRKSPLFLGQTIHPKSFNNRQTPLESMSFDQALQRHAALESIQGRVKIVGNPQLLNESLSRDYTASNIDNGSGATIVPDIYRRPGYVKINIRYPSDKELSSTKKFWYDGYYHIFAIQNDFSGGVFTQTLDLFSVPASSAVPKTLASQDLSNQINEATAQPEFVVEDNKENVDQIEVPFTIDRVRDGDTGNEPRTFRPEVDIWIKQSAKLGKLDQKVYGLYDDIIAIWKKHAPEVRPVITSGNDSRHKTNSLHYENFAIDLRANNLHPNQATSIEIGKRIARDLAIRVGNDYDVIYESYANYSNNHIHLEYDPKPRATLPETSSEQRTDH